MIFTSENKLPNKEQGKDCIFLAGSMDLEKSVGWRKKVVNQLSKDEKYCFLDPTHIKHDFLSASKMEAHVLWELNALELADRILLVFLKESLSPISLVELGLYVRTKKMIVVCPKEFYKIDYITVLCKKYQTTLVHSLEQAIQVLS